MSSGVRSTVTGGLHFELTRLAIALGPGNPLVTFLIRRRCRAHGVEAEFDHGVLDLRKDRRILRIPSRHFVYAPALAERFETYFEPIVPEVRGGDLIVDYSTPRLHTYRKSGLEFEIPSFPEEDDAIEGYFHWYQPRLGDLVFDLGAHCGVSTHAFSTMVGPHGRVIAFEPDPLNYSLLLRNLERHSLKNVTPVKAAIAAQRGKASFYSEGTIASCLATKSPRATVGEIETVDTMTLKDATGQWGIPAFCKIDIEGAEIEVLGASGELLRTLNTQFAIDTNHLVEGALTTARVECILAASGYDVKSSKINDMTTTWARPMRRAG